MRTFTLPALFLLSIGLLLLNVGVQAESSNSAKIKKCQDANGHWHYGDTADDLCRQSKVVEINKQGIATKEIAAPLTAEQLKQQENNKASLEAQQKLAAEQARQDQLLLSTYGHEDDISFVRDRKIADTDAQIQSSQKTLTALRNTQKRTQAQAAEEQHGNKPLSEATTKQLANIEAQIAKHEAYIASKQKEIEAIRAQATKDIERYRLLKKNQASALPAGATPAQ